MANRRSTSCSVAVNNFEQLQTRAGLLVELLEQADGLRIIATSRTRLNLRGEQVIMLDGLPAPEDAAADEVASLSQFRDRGCRGNFEGDWVVSRLLNINPNRIPRRCHCGYDQRRKVAAGNTSI